MIGFDLSAEILWWVAFYQGVSFPGEGQLSGGQSSRRQLSGGSNFPQAQFS